MKFQKCPESGGYGGYGNGMGHEGMMGDYM